MTKEIAEAINAVSKKVNECMAREDVYATSMHNVSTDSIETTDGGVTELAEMIADLEERVAALEAKEA